MVATMASTANFGLTLTASASLRANTASMQRGGRRSGGAWAASAATTISGWLAPA